MSANSVRCPNCGKRIRESVRICPACGTEQPLHIHRIRCHYCDRRVPSNVALCPNCKHDPRGFYVRASWLRTIAVLGLALGVAWLAFNPPIRFDVQSLLQVPTPTRLAAIGPELIVVTATLPATPTPTARPATVPNTREPTMTLTLVPPTPTYTQSPTVRPITPAAPVVGTPVPTATSSPALRPPLLVAPANGERMSGRKRIINLTFQPVELGPKQWYRIQVDFKDREDRFASWCGWTRDNFIRFPMDYYDDTWQLDRTFRWQVKIVNSDANPPSTCAAPSADQSPASPVWTFYWY